MEKVSVGPGPADVTYQTQAQAGGFAQTLASFVKFLDLAPGAAVLDVGTGPGLVTRLLSERGALVVGCDLSREMLEQARALSAPLPASSLPLLVADAQRLPFAVASFDAALATNLLFLLPDPFAGVCELARVTQVGGVVGWLNPSHTLTQASAAAFADERGLEGFARFSLINYARIAEGQPRRSNGEWVEMARRAGLSEIVTEGRGGGLMTIMKGRRAAYA